jgi:MoxR-like ATPase
MPSCRLGQRAAIALPAGLVAVLAELRQHFADPAAGRSPTGAGSRSSGCCAWPPPATAAPTRPLWDLLLLPWLTAPDAPRQAIVADWLAARLGVREAFSPARLTRVVEAFEAQLQAELQANDLDYDELRPAASFSSVELAEEIGDAKGGAAAPRMMYSRRRRYGATHVNPGPRPPDRRAAGTHRRLCR